MKTILNYSILLLVFCSQLWADPHIFSCIETDDLDCLKREVIICTKWKKATNKAQETLIDVAIRKKNIEALQVLLNHDAPVQQKNIIAGMKVFFDVDESFFTNSLDVWEAWLNAPVEPMVMASVLLGDFKSLAAPARREALAKIMNLFVSPEHISLYVGVTDKKQDTAEKLTAHYKNIFFHGNNLDTENLKLIVTNLLSTHLYKLTLQLIIDTYLTTTIKPLVIPAPPANIPQEYKQIENVTAAIMEHSRSLMVHVHPRSLVQLVQNKTPDTAIDKVADFTDRLGKFAELSIKFPTTYRHRLKNYQFWHKVYRNLAIRGDFVGAFALGLGLNHSEVERALKEKDLLDTPITAPDNNFRAYRDAIKMHENGSYLPSIQFILKDLTAIYEMGIFEDGSAKTIKPHALEHLASFKTEYSMTLHFARTRVLKCDENIKRALDLLPPLDAQTSLLWWQQIYKTMLFGEPLTL